MTTVTWRLSFSERELKLLRLDFSCWGRISKFSATGGTSSRENSVQWSIYMK